MIVSSGVPSYSFISISVLNAIIAIYGLARILRKFRLALSYILLGISFLLNVLLPFGYFSIILYTIGSLCAVLMGSYMFVITFAFRRPNTNLRILELFFTTWIVYLVTGFVPIIQFNIIVSLLLGVYGICISIYSLGSLKSEFTADCNRRRTVPAYLCCFNQGTTNIVVTHALIEEKDLAKGVSLGTSAHILLIGVFILMGACISMFTEPDYYTVFQVATIPVWNIMIHLCLSIYDIGGQSPRFSFCGLR
eukprot:NODE_80_length_22759_cov_1.466858.p10 type:complete len:250 gc:universal NODE_80_length_22759_cov_1.466858:7705-6956(-)